jgi:hypothetical protein
VPHESAKDCSRTNKMTHQKRCIVAPNAVVSVKGNPCDLSASCINLKKMNVRISVANVKTPQ